MSSANSVHNKISSTEKRIRSALRSLNCGLGVLAADITTVLGMSRRTVNRYLKILKDRGQATRDGWFWRAE